MGGSIHRNIDVVCFHFNLRTKTFRFFNLLIYVVCYKITIMNRVARITMKRCGSQMWVASRQRRDEDDDEFLSFGASLLLEITADFRWLESAVNLSHSWSSGVSRGCVCLTNRTTLSLSRVIYCRELTPRFRFFYHSDLNSVHRSKICENSSYIARIVLFLEYSRWLEF